MEFFGFSIANLPFSVALATLAALGYMARIAGRERRTASNRSASNRTTKIDSADERRARTVARRLETIAEQLRRQLASHHASVDRFRRSAHDWRIDRDDVAFEQLCQQAQSMIEPTRQLTEELAQAYNEIRNQKIQLASPTTAAERRASKRRATLDASLSAMFAQLESRNRTFSLAVVQVDPRLSGDEPLDRDIHEQRLQRIAESIHDQLDDDDVQIRFSNDEFVLLFSDADLEAAVERTQRIRRSICGALGRSVRAGVVQARKEENADALLARADAALYAARSAGQSSIFAHDGQTMSASRGDDIQIEPTSARPRESAAGSTV